MSGDMPAYNDKTKAHAMGPLPAMRTSARITVGSSTALLAPLLSMMFFISSLDRREGMMRVWEILLLTSVEVLRAYYEGK